MKTLSERMNMVEYNSSRSNAYTIHDLSTGTGTIDLVDTFCLACAEQEVALSAHSDDEFWAAQEQFCDYVKGAQARSVDTISIWFDE